MNKVTLTKGIFELYQQLERLEEVLVFSVFYPLSRAFDYHGFLPGFHLDGEYYEIHQNSDDDELILLRFGNDARIGAQGYDVTEKEVLEIVERLKEL
jgi:hypothetical protein